MDEKRCCLAIFETHEQMLAARQILNGTRNKNLSLSFFYEPDSKCGEIKYIDHLEIGALSGHGPLADALVARTHDPVSHSAVLTTLLADIGVPESHHHIYETRLDQGHSLLIMQGPENELRMGCEVLTPLCLEKPIIYFR